MNRGVLGRWLLQLTLCIVMVMRRTSSQSTYDVSNCGSSDQGQLSSAVSQLISAVSRLQADISELKKGNKCEDKNASAGECPHGFTYISSVNSCYAVVRRNLEWPIAALNCRSLHRNAHLVVINDAREQQAVASLLQNTNKSGCQSHPHSSFSKGPYFWTAGHRVDPTYASGFIWRTTGTNPCDGADSLMTYTNWQTGQPNFASQHCMEVASGQDYTWHDDSCSYTRCSVCELGSP